MKGIKESPNLTPISSEHSAQVEEPQRKERGSLSFCLCARLFIEHLLCAWLGVLRTTL